MIHHIMVRKVIKALLHAGYVPGSVSPNQVSYFAFANGFKLNSMEVVYISNVF